MESNEDEDTNPSKQCMKKAISKVRVGVIAILLILSQSLQVVCFKRSGYSLGPYPYFILLSVSAFFIPIFALTVLFIRVTGGPFIKEIVRCKFICHYCVVGFLNGLNGVLVIFSNPHVGGIMQALLTQTVIPWTLVLSCAYLKSSFSLTQYLGASIATAAIVFAGVGNSILENAGGSHDGTHLNATIVRAPFDLANDRATPFDLANDRATPSSLLSTIMWTLIFGLGQVPLAFSGIYQEKTFRKAQVNVFYMLFWASVAQFVTLVVVLPTNFLPWFGGLSPSSFLLNMESAVMCVANHNTSSVPVASGCSSAALNLLLCVSFMLLSTLLQTMMVKYSSAALSVMAITLVTPVSAFAFTLPWLLGPHVEAFTWVQWIALAFLMVGILTYRQNDIRESICPRNRHRQNGELDDKERPLLMEEGEKLRELAADRPRSMSLSCATSCGGPLDGDASTPRLLNSRGGIITSEYTAGGGRTRILYQGVRVRSNTV